MLETSVPYRNRLYHKCFAPRNSLIARQNNAYTARPCNTIVEPLYSVQVPSMPDHPTYIHKLEEILVRARSPKPIPFFRRRDVEALFGLKKRQAVNLMHQIGAVRVSRELAIEQRELVRWLEADDIRALRGGRAAPAGDAVIGRIVELKAETAARAIKSFCRIRGLRSSYPTGFRSIPVG